MTIQRNQHNDDIFQSEKWTQLETSHEVLDRPDKFAEYFEGVCGSQRKIKDVFKKELLELLSTNVDARREIMCLIKLVEKEEVKFWIKKVGIGIWSIVVFVGGIIAAKLLDLFWPGK
jgi:hypothetical protein